MSGIHLARNLRPTNQQACCKIKNSPRILSALVSYRSILNRIEVTDPGSLRTQRRLLTISRWRRERFDFRSSRWELFEGQASQRDAADVTRAIKSKRGAADERRFLERKAHCERQIVNSLDKNSCKIEPMSREKPTRQDPPTGDPPSKKPPVRPPDHDRRKEPPRREPPTKEPPLKEPPSKKPPVQEPPGKPTAFITGLRFFESAFVQSQEHGHLSPIHRPERSH